VICFLCGSPIELPEQENAPQVNRSGERAHRRCATAYWRGYGNAQAVARAHAPIYLRSDFQDPFTRRVAAITLVYTGLRGGRIELRFDNALIAWISSVDYAALRVLLDEVAPL
jgi:hypothetical protein